METIIVVLYSVEILVVVANVAALTSDQTSPTSTVRPAVENTEGESFWMAPDWENPSGCLPTGRILLDGS